MAGILEVLSVSCTVLRLVINAVLAIVGIRIVDFLVDGLQGVQFLGISASLKVQSVVRELLANVGTLFGLFGLSLIVLVETEKSKHHHSETTIGVRRSPARMSRAGDISDVVRVLKVILRKLFKHNTHQRQRPEKCDISRKFVLQRATSSGRTS